MNLHQFGPSPRCSATLADPDLLAFPIGANDPGYVDPFDMLKARTANQIQEPNALIYLTRAATDDEILAAYHDLPLLTLAVALVAHPSRWDPEG